MVKRQAQLTKKLDAPTKKSLKKEEILTKYSTLSDFINN
jgi:hypothetical protein